MALLESVPGTIFTQPWWLDAVAPGSWSEVRVEKGGSLVARLPYVFRDTAAGRMIHMPPLTQTLGPWVDLGEGKLTKRIGRNKELMTELIRQLPEFASFRQNFDYSVDNWMPWHWQGFRQTTRYTYVIDDLSDKDRVWSNFDAKLRNEIRKAENQIELQKSDDLDSFWRLNRMVFERQNIEVPYSRELVARLDQVLAERNQRVIIFARDGAGRLHAGAYVVWDAESAYYLMGGSDPALRNSGAMSACLWAAIQHVAALTGRFDFEGSMIESIEGFVRAFGGVPKPYSAISKESRRFALLRTAKTGMRKMLLRGR